MWRGLREALHYYSANCRTQHWHCIAWSAVCSSPGQPELDFAVNANFYLFRDEFQLDTRGAENVPREEQALAKIYRIKSTF